MAMRAVQEQGALSPTDDELTAIAPSTLQTEKSSELTLRRAALATPGLPHLLDFGEDIEAASDLIRHICFSGKRSSALAPSR